MDLVHPFVASELFCCPLHMAVKTTHVAFLNFTEDFLPSEFAVDHIRKRENFCLCVSMVKGKDYRVRLSAIYTRMRGFVFPNTPLHFNASVGSSLLIGLWILRLIPHRRVS